MKRFPIFFVALLVGALNIGALVLSHGSAIAAKTTPSLGWTVHIDANRHCSEEHPGAIAHHILPANAHLVAVETIVPKKCGTRPT